MTQTQSIVTLEFTTSHVGRFLQIRLSWAEAGLTYEMLKHFAERVVALDIVTDTGQDLSAQHIRSAKVQRTTVTEAFVADFVYGG